MENDASFDKDYFEGNQKSSENKHCKSREKINSLFFPKAVINEKISRGSRVLDVGCAFGHFLKLCDEYDFQTYGVDISEYAIKEAKKNTRAKLLVHNVDNGLDIFENNFFDLITFFDVIEHVESPHRVLKSAHRITKEGGKIIITTPNLDSMGRKILNKKWHGYQDGTHRYLFTPLALTYLASNTGFEILKLETPFHPLPKIIQKLANKTGLGGQIWMVAVKKARNYNSCNPSNLYVD